MKHSWLAPAAKVRNPPFVLIDVNGPERTLVQHAANGSSEPNCVNSIFSLRVLAAQKMRRVHNNLCCHAAGKPAIHARRSETTD
jgi:hypothetical protein